MFSGFASALQVIYLLGSLTVQSYICQPPTAPSITTPLTGTSVNASVPFLVAGNGPTESTITISSDGNNLVSVQADESNHFSASVTLSNEGPHTLAVQASRPCGNAIGNQITVYAGEAPVVPVEPTPPSEPTKTEQQTSRPNTGSSSNSTPEAENPKPNTSSDSQNTSNNLLLVINTPTNNSTTTDSSVFVNGTTSAPSTIEVLVNNESIGMTHTPLASFGMSVPLVVGENSIVIKAKSNNGSASVQLTITRQETDVQTPWYHTQEGQTTIRIAAVSVVTILVILVIIGIILL